ncbi:MAG: LemA family protein [Bacteroidetes bacterium]|uniref:LemA family protein n=1 Tax=Candidatus Cryptobacteroides gallistercoris TaxID=2840765 RepID=A0A940DN69_9BACT|nr:LemA family protein [Candidatus Cryptobacteroides gallistercoris]
MKKGCAATAILVAVIVLVLFFWTKSSYNGLVRADEQVSAAWAQVENVYQRRADLIDNLVATVKGYAGHESSTLEEVTAARSRATQITLDPEGLDAEAIARYQDAQGELSQAIGRLLMVTENYPDLKANRNFLDLQAQLEGTENRISTERMKFNEAARAYNTMVRSFPKNIIASIFGFGTKGYFKAESGAETAPEVKF